MSDVTTSSAQRASYELNFELDGSSFAVRENLADIVRRELLGPIHGPEEVLPFSPKSQYLVGLIAPVKLSGSTKASADDAPDDRGELIEVRTDEDAVDGGRGVPVDAVDDT